MVLAASSFFFVSCGGGGADATKEAKDSNTTKMDSASDSSGSAKSSSIPASVSKDDATFVVNTANANMTEIQLGQLAQQKGMMKDVKDYVNNGITNDELVFMQSAIGQRDALRYETGPQKANFIRNILTYNLPANFTATQQKIMKSMTKKEIDAMAKKWINPDKMNMLLVGDKAKILPGLQKLGYPIVELDADGKPVGKKAF